MYFSSSTTHHLLVFSHWSSSFRFYCSLFFFGRLFGDGLAKAPHAIWPDWSRFRFSLFFLLSTAVAVEHNNNKTQKKKCRKNAILKCCVCKLIELARAVDAPLSLVSEHNVGYLHCGCVSVWEFVFDGGWLPSITRVYTVIRSRWDGRTPKCIKSQTRWIKLTPPNRKERKKKQRTRRQHKKRQIEDAKKKRQTESGVKVLSCRINRGNFNRTLPLALSRSSVHLYFLFFSILFSLAFWLSPAPLACRRKKTFFFVPVVRALFHHFSFLLPLSPSFVWVSSFFRVFAVLRASNICGFALDAVDDVRWRRRDERKVPFNCDYLIFIGAYENHLRFDRCFCNFAFDTMVDGDDDEQRRHTHFNFGAFVFRFLWQIEFSVFVSVFRFFFRTFFYMEFVAILFIGRTSSHLITQTMFLWGVVANAQTLTLHQFWIIVIFFLRFYFADGAFFTLFFWPKSFRSYSPFVLFPWFTVCSFATVARISLDICFSSELLLTILGSLWTRLIQAIVVVVVAVVVGVNVIFTLSYCSPAHQTAITCSSCSDCTTKRMRFMSLLHVFAIFTTHFCAPSTSEAIKPFIAALFNVWFYENRIIAIT